MRMLFVILTGLSLIFVVTVAWYFSQPVVLSLSNAFISELSGDALSVMHLVQFANIIWGPLFDILIITWMIASAQARDIESERYR